MRLIREEIATHYKIALQKALAEAEVMQGDVDKKRVYAHPIPPSLNQCLNTSSLTSKKVVAP
ncbi:hypothetical protein GO003_004970 [Methylicorpusculum oleiharenae]|uniref:hypothetical protein n=1 Tax=Methylicorpusculum oleiharenae TaxID=1338687 RepID=UPI0019D11997|nr:hypothetical protein [Methylicorpusculum oleiharenae]MCD2449741.1 hypothetical protein [Methylicorpusculum oleiharenae]